VGRLERPWGLSGATASPNWREIGRVSGLRPKNLTSENPVVNIPAASPSRHICNSLTIVVAFLRPLAFDWVWQHLVKVDGTFA
jgi:hypothetical protein